MRYMKSNVGNMKDTRGHIYTHLYIVIHEEKYEYCESFEVDAE